MFIYWLFSVWKESVFICINPYIYTSVVQEVYNRDRSPEIGDDEGSLSFGFTFLLLLWYVDLDYWVKINNSCVVEFYNKEMLSCTDFCVRTSHARFQFQIFVRLLFLSQKV